jgi:hypothetical protein
MVRTDSLRAFIDSAPFPAVPGGDDGKSSIKLVPIEKVCRLKLAKKVPLV